MKLILTIAIFIASIIIALPGSASTSVPVFVPYANNPLISSYTVVPYSLFKLDDQYHMYFLERLPDYNLDLMISSDGLTWGSEIHRNVFSPTQTGKTFNYYACVVKQSGIYKAWHSATSDGNIAGTKLYYSTSADGISYVGQGVVLDNGTYPEYDSRNINQPFVIFDGTRYHLYYSAFPGYQSGPPNPSSNTSVAYATSPDGINWTKHGAIIQHGIQDLSMLLMHIIQS